MPRQVVDMGVPMIIDFHTHTFPKHIRENREKYFPSEPAFKLLYDSKGSKLVGMEEIIASMDKDGVDMSVIFGFPWQNADTFKENNDYIIEAVNRYPNRFKGLCCLDPFNQKAVPETLRCIEEGLSGVGELAFYQSGIDDQAVEKLEPVMKICREKDKIILIHTNEPVGHMYPGKTPITLMQIYTMIKKFPDNKIVLAHWGGGIFFFNLLKKEVKKKLANVYFDTAASPFLYDPEIYKFAVGIMGADNILLGSDFPLLKPSRYFKEIEKSGISRAEAEKICGLNAAKLLGI